MGLYLAESRLALALLSPTRNNVILEFKAQFSPSPDRHRRWPDSESDAGRIAHRNADVIDHWSVCLCSCEFLLF